MNKLLRMGLAALMFSSAVLAPWVAVGLYNVSPYAQERGGWGMLNELTGRVTLFLNRNGEIQKLGANNAVVGALDERDLVLTIADIGTAQSAYIVMPTTGAITRIEFTGDGPLIGGSTVIRMYSDAVAALGQKALLYTDARVTAFGLTLTQDSIKGTRFTDDTINHAVVRGTVIALETDGATTGTLAGRFVITIQEQ